VTHQIVITVIEQELSSRQHNIITVDYPSDSL